jgi:hypothetical protein
LEAARCSVRSRIATSRRRLLQSPGRTFRPLTGHWSGRERPLPGHPSTGDPGMVGRKPSGSSEPLRRPYSDVIRACPARGASPRNGVVRGPGSTSVSMRAGTVGWHFRCLRLTVVDDPALCRGNSGCRSAGTLEFLYQDGEVLAQTKSTNGSRASLLPSVPRLAGRVIAPFPTGRKALPPYNIWCAFVETLTK